MLRETKDFKTPTGHTIVVKTYLTGREARDLQTPYLKTSEEFPKEVIDAKGLRAACYQAVQDLTLKTVIVSFDGSTQGLDGFDVIETILNLPATETNFIMKSINDIISPPDADEEKKTN